MITPGVRATGKDLAMETGAAHEIAWRRERMPENQRFPARAAADGTFAAIPTGAMERAAEMPHAVEPAVAHDPRPLEDRLQIAGNDAPSRGFRTF